MAKSLRSKRRRKMRSIRREKFGKKELERLKGVVEAAKKQEKGENELYTVKTAQEVKQSKNDNSAGSSMEVDITSINRKGLKNEHGNYPKWMSQRKVRKVKRREKKRDKRKKK